MSWTCALLLILAVLGALEFFWRSHGYQPAVVDDQRLWSIERSKIGRSGKQVALLGSSRMQTDVSMATFRKLLPDYEIINLSIDGTCGNAVLKDLAADRDFRGVAVCETTSECIMFGDNPELSQRSYVEYYHRAYNINARINREIATWLQKHLVFIDPYLNPIKIAGELVQKKKLRPPNYVTTYEDRSRSADYTKLDITAHKDKRLRKVQVNYHRLAASISTTLLTEKMLVLNESVKRIQERCGKVVFARFPVSAEHWNIDEQYFPRKQYWDTLRQLTVAGVSHFRDIEEMRKIECPDTSHLDLKDTAIYTSALIAELKMSKVF